MPRVVAIHSYRGGTGKSNLTANLAATVARYGHRVAIVDTDLQSPGIHVLFGLNGESVTQTLNDYLWDRCAIEEVAYDCTPILYGDAAESSPVEGRGSLYLLPASICANEIARILGEGYNVSRLNDGCRQLVKSMDLDYLFIDTHPGLSKESFLSIVMANILLLILRPDNQDFQGTAVTVDVARQLHVRKMMLIVNKVLSCVDLDSLRDKVEQTYQVPVAGLFPLSEDMIHLGSGGLFCLRYPDHPLTETLKQVAKQILS
ncbi:MAG: MinD/ParA family protein [Oculatellaceae cyanobacterium Prado106]|jgi:MinD-like ATPase involved in chromosome partitioning or flagellar assembly|nr:MinD/ParA family protein [Oculatellaceae cyanobacterium Prado106]